MKQINSYICQGSTPLHDCAADGHIEVILKNKFINKKNLFTFDLTAAFAAEYDSIWERKKKCKCKICCKHLNSWRNDLK